MRTTLPVVIGCGLLAGMLWAQDPPPLKDGKDKLSYSIGMNIGTNLKRQSADVDLDLLVRGIRDTLAGKPQLTDAESREVMASFTREWRAKEQEKRKVEGEKNLKDGEKFLTENKAKPDVVTLPSGLQYKVLKPGDGASPKTSDQVVAHYRGTLIDGTEFDSSYKRGQPFTAAVTGVVKGWTEALQLMKPGAKWQLFIPPNLAYGEQGAPPQIGANATLVFEMELLEVKAAPAAAPAAPPQVTSDIIRVPSAEEMKKGAKIEIIKPEDLAKLTNKPPAQADPKEQK